jgi:hypothetical protein
LIKQIGLFLCELIFSVSVVQEKGSMRKPLN